MIQRKCNYAQAQTEEEAEEAAEHRHSMMMMMMMDAAAHVGGRGLACITFQFQFSLVTLKPRTAHANANIIINNKKKKKKDYFTVHAHAGASAGGGPLKVIILGPPGCGKSDQSEMIAKQYDLLHISAGDILRREVASGSENGKKAREFIEKGLSVSDEVVSKIMKDFLVQCTETNGWLLEGYPHSQSQTRLLENLQIYPDAFILLEVPKEILVERLVERGFDPITGKVYHLKYSPPENKKIEARLIRQFDHTQEKVISFLETYQKNLEEAVSVYKSLVKKIDGNRVKELVFEDIDGLLKRVLQGDWANSVSQKSLEERRLSNKKLWKGIPTRLNNIPHSREIREYFYEDVRAATVRSVESGINRLKVDISIPELNPNTDVFRIGTLMELVRVIALNFAYNGQRVKVCVQSPMGEGGLVGMPLQLAGTRRILEFMDWGEHGELGTFIKIGSIGALEVTDEDDMFILVAPQNAVGNCIIHDLQAMTEAAGSRPMILVNPRLQDIPSSEGVMQTIGREKRLEFVNSFSLCYHFRLIYQAGTEYPIMGGIRLSYPNSYELYKRIDIEHGKEKYVNVAMFSKEPNSEQIRDAFHGRLRLAKSEPAGLWSLLRSILS